MPNSLPDPYVPLQINQPIAPSILTLRNTVRERLDTSRAQEALLTPPAHWSRRIWNAIVHSI